MIRIGLPSARLRSRILGALALAPLTAEAAARMLGRNPAHVAVVMRGMRIEGVLATEPRRSGRSGRPALVYRRATA